MQITKTLALNETWAIRSGSGNDIHVGDDGVGVEK
jgi:hypothetical protein